MDRPLPRRRRLLLIAGVLLALAGVAALIAVLVNSGSGGPSRPEQAQIVPPKREVIAAVISADPTGSGLRSQPLRQAALDRLGAARVFAREAEGRGLRVRQELIDEQVALVARSCCGDDPGRLEAWLGQRGTNTAALRQVVATQLAADLLRADLVVKTKPRISAAQLRAAYRSRRALLAQPATRMVEIARFPDRASAVAGRARIAAAKGPTARQKVIRELSSDPSAPGGGLMLVRRPVKGAPDTDAALTKRAFALRTGTVSPVFRSSASGWLVVVASTDATPAHTPSFTEVKERLREQLQAEAGQRAWARYVARLASAGRFRGITPPAVSELVPQSLPTTPPEPAPPTR